MDTNANKTLVRRFVRDVLQDLRPDAVDELVAADFRSHTWGFQGDHRDGLKKATERMGAALADIEFTVDDMIAEGDRVAARATSSATPKGAFHGAPHTGRRYTIGEIHIFRIADGRIAEHWHQFDDGAMLRQLRGED